VGIAEKTRVAFVVKPVIVCVVMFGTMFLIVVISKGGLPTNGIG
jgi:hypothetical protein